jgi:hypothetical protein
VLIFVVIHFVWEFFDSLDCCCLWRQFTQAAVELVLLLLGLPLQLLLLLLMLQGQPLPTDYA